MNITATGAKQTANQARSAAAAYEAAFAATVPPPLIAENRALMASLVATNVLGQNTPAIAANEAQYAEMWAQDAAAMYGYAGASAAATQLTPFTASPQTTSMAAVSTPASAVGQAATSAAPVQGAAALSNVVSVVPNALQSLATGGSDPLTSLESLVNSPLVTSLNALFGAMATNLLPVASVTLATSAGLFLVAPLYDIAVAQGSAAPAVSAGVPALAPTGSAGLGADLSDLGGEMSATLGRAGSVGGLSVPQSWGSAAPEIRLAARTSPLAGLGGVAPEAAAAPAGWFGGMPPVGSLVNAPRTGGPRAQYRNRPKVLAQAPGETGVHDDPLDRRAQPNRQAQISEEPLSERERDELNALRDEIADLAMERDAAARLIREAIQR